MDLWVHDNTFPHRSGSKQPWSFLGSKQNATIYKMCNNYNRYTHIYEKKYKYIVLFSKQYIKHITYLLHTNDVYIYICTIYIYIYIYIYIHIHIYIYV